MNKIQNITIKTILAIFVVVFCLFSLAFLKLSDSVINLYSVLVTAVISYYFGSSTGSSAKDKVIQEMNTQNTNSEIK
jgi:uncharacterized membrane protein